MTGSDSQGAHPARTRSILLTALLALLLCGVFAGAAQAIPLTPTDAPLDGTDFQGGDGDQDAEPLLRDWESLVGQPGLVSTSDPNALDSTFGTGSHENDPEHWDILEDPDGVTPGKANFFNSWSYVDERDHTFLYLAFDRQESGGNVFLAFELNQDTRLWINASGDAIQCRTEGDLIISYEIQNDDNIDVIIQRWISDSEVTAADVAGGYTNGLGCSKTGHFEEFDPDPSDVQGAINAGEVIENFLPGGPEPTIGEELFGEAALDLTDIFAGLTDNPCFSFGQISLHGRSSESDSASMQDLVGPVPLLVRNCTASGTKYHDLNANGNQDAGEPGLTGFRIWADYDNDGVIDANEPFDDTDANGDYSIANINPPDGNYSLREKLTVGAGTDGWICSEPTTTIANGPFPCAYVDIDSGDEPNVIDKDFGNYKKATVIVEKQTVPDGASASFAFTSTITGKASFNLTDGQQNSTEVTPGVYTATETPVPAGWTLTDITCSGDTLPPNSSDAGATATFNAQSGETIKCTFTNTRDTGKLTVIKQLVPESDPGLFDLKIEDEVVVDDASDGDSGFRVLDTGDYDVSELAGTGTSLAKYDSKVECSNGQSAVPGTSLADVHVTKDSDITCTFTNTRRTGKLTVVKDLIPSNDPGLFDLRINSEVVADDVGDGGSGSRDLAPGDYTVSELAGTGTSLAKYDSKIDCDNGDSGTGTSLAGVSIDSNDDVTCTITNTRRTGKLTVVKDLIPSNDPGLFDLRINSEVVADDVGDGGSGSRDLAPGDYTVSELAGTGTSLADYSSAIECDNGDSGSGTSLAGVSVDSNDDITCTITNTRNPGKLTVVKDLIPANDDGTFNLKIEDEVVATGGDGATGSRDLPPGSYDVSETGAAGTDLTKYDKSISCDNGQSGDGALLANVVLESNDDVTCTITNTRRTGKLTVVKDLIPSNDPGLFDLRINSEVVADDVGDGGSGSRDLAPGDYTVSELAGTGTSLAKYDSKIDCDNGDSGTGTSLAGVSIDSNDDVTCTITNTRRTGKLTVVKDLIPSNDPGLFDLRINSEVVADDVGDGGSGSRDLAPGDYTVSELAGTGTSLAKYDSSIECDNGDSGIGHVARRRVDRLQRRRDVHDHEHAPDGQADGRQAAGPGGRRGSVRPADQQRGRGRRRQRWRQRLA